MASKVHCITVPSAPPQVTSRWSSSDRKRTFVTPPACAKTETKPPRATLGKWWRRSVPSECPVTKKRCEALRSAARTSSPRPFSGQTPCTGQPSTHVHVFHVSFRRVFEDTGTEDVTPVEDEDNAPEVELSLVDTGFTGAEEREGEDGATPRGVGTPALNGEVGMTVVAPCDDAPSTDATHAMPLVAELDVLATTVGPGVVKEGRSRWNKCSKSSPFVWTTQPSREKSRCHTEARCRRNAMCRFVGRATRPQSP